MDIKIQTKISVLLEKINYLQHSINQNGDVVNKIDKDLLVNYVRELYELCLSIPIQNSTQYQPPYLPQQTPDFINPYQQQNYPPPNYQPGSFPPNSGINNNQPSQQNYSPQQPYYPPQQPANKSDYSQANIESKGIKTSGGNENANGNGNGSSLNSSFNFSNGKRTLSESIQIKTAHEKQSVNEQFARNEKSEIAKKSMTPIKDLKTFIGLNKRFSYINFLFNNDANLYDDAIDKINSCSNINEALSYINNLLQSKLKWDDKNEMVSEFNILVQRRFLM